MVADVYSIVIIKVFCNLFKHNAEKDAEESWCQNTTLFHADDDGKDPERSLFNQTCVVG